MADHGVPRITPELAQAVNRLGYLRRQLKDLETEETLLRERILSEVASWPPEWLPAKVGSFEVRLGQRKGRIDAKAALELLTTAKLLSEVPSEPAIRSTESVQALGHGLARLAMPEETRNQLVDGYRTAIEWHPVITQDILSSLLDRSRISAPQYRACFKDGQPIIPMLTVR